MNSSILHHNVMGGLSLICLSLVWEWAVESWRICAIPMILMSIQTNRRVGHNDVINSKKLFFHDFWSFGAVQVTFREGFRQKQTSFVVTFFDVFSAKKKTMFFGVFTPLAKSSRFLHHYISGVFAIHYACGTGDERLTETLLDAQANVNVLDSEQRYYLLSLHLTSSSNNNSATIFFLIWVFFVIIWIFKLII